MSVFPRLSVISCSLVCALTLAGCSQDSEMIDMVKNSKSQFDGLDVGAMLENTKVDWKPKWAEVLYCRFAMIRSAVVGFFLGLLPGCAPAVTTFIAYDIEKRFSKHRSSSLVLPLIFNLGSKSTTVCSSIWRAAASFLNILAVVCKNGNASMTKNF